MLVGRNNLHLIDPFAKGSLDPFLNLPFGSPPLAPSINVDQQSPSLQTQERIGGDAERSCTEGRPSWAWKGGRKV